MEKNAAELIKGISTAIELERQAYSFYSSKAETLGNKFITGTFEFLAKQEQEHEHILTKLKDELKKGKWDSKDASEFEHKSFPEAEKHLRKEYAEQEKAGSDEISAVLWAMRAERRAELLYLGLKSKSSSKESKDFFQFMADFELGHYNMLDKIVEDLTDATDYLQN